MILVFDTSTDHLSVALADAEGRVLIEAHAKATPLERGVHDARLALEVERLLSELHAEPSDLRRVGLVIGPGSFTGLRIGLSFAKGLASALEIPVVPVTQHEVLKAEAQAGGLEASVIITEAYKPGIVYRSEWGAPRNIELVETSALLGTTRALIHDALIDSPILKSMPQAQPVFAPISPTALARLTAAATEVVVADLESLEPLYITEFKPHA